MSFWSAIGLADRFTMEGLMEQIQSLQAENKRLEAENCKLINQQIQKQSDETMQVFNTKLNFMLEKIQSGQDAEYQQYQRLIESIHKLREGQGGLDQALDGQCEMIRQTVMACQNESVSNYQDLVSGIELLGREQAKLEHLIGQQSDSIQKKISYAENTAAERKKECMDLFDKMSVQFQASVKEFQDTRKHYEKIVHSEDQCIDKLEVLSKQFALLSQEQRKVMEKLGMLCEHSDQFMEIQKSINDMWEIMKVVWVDSLLNFAL